MKKLIYQKGTITRSRDQKTGGLRLEFKDEQGYLVIF